MQKNNELSILEIRILSLAAIGGALEFYDYIIFVFFAQVIGKLFFGAAVADWVRQAEVFGIFSAGYVARPIGGIVMAHFGDTRGRKRVFVVSVLLIAVSTLLVGLLPTYQSIGTVAPLLLLLLRLLQGVAIGGEVPGAWVFVAEHARRVRVGLAIGLLTCGLSFGILLGSFTTACLNHVFTRAQIAAGAWRIPFVIGGVLGFIAMWLRRWLAETPVFEELRKRAALSRRLPLRVVLKHHMQAVVTSILSTWVLTAAIVVVILMTPLLLTESFGVAPSQAQLASLVGTVALCLSTVIVGAATDRFGIIRVGVPMVLLLIVSTYALFKIAATEPLMHVGTTPGLIRLYALAGFGAGVVVITPILMIRSFPATVRFSGVSFSYNFGYALFGGVTPLLVSLLSHFDRFAPAYYVAVVAVIGLGATVIATAMNHLRYTPEIGALECSRMNEPACSTIFRPTVPLSESGNGRGETKT
jgi:MFS family permease